MGVFGSESQTGRARWLGHPGGEEDPPFPRAAAEGPGGPEAQTCRPFRKPDLSLAESSEIRQAIEALGARRTMQELTEGLAAEARGIITSLPVPDEHARILNEICDGSLRRKR